MSIERIGKNNGVTGIIAPEPGRVVSSEGRMGETFRVGRAASPESICSLDQLRAGEISLSRYLDAKVEAATQHLVGRLDVAHLEFIQNHLREQLSSDPVLIELVRAASSGLSPTPPTHE